MLIDLPVVSVQFIPYRSSAFDIRWDYRQSAAAAFTVCLPALLAWLGVVREAVWVSLGT